MQTPEEFAWEVLASDDFVLTPHEVLTDLVRARDAEVAEQARTRALRDAADAVPVDLWCVYGMAARVHVEGFQEWLRERADRIEQDD